MTNTQVNLRIDDDMIATLDQMAGKALNRQAIARMFLIAAIEAVQHNCGRINLPPRFAVVNEPDLIPARLNEPKPITYTRKK